MQGCIVLALFVLALWYAGLLWLLLLGFSAIHCIPSLLCRLTAGTSCIYDCSTVEVLSVRVWALHAVL
jgi:hypothetical protein